MKKERKRYSLHRAIEEMPQFVEVKNGFWEYRGIQVVPNAHLINGADSIIQIRPFTAKEEIKKIIRQEIRKLPTESIDNQTNLYIDSSLHPSW